MKIRSVAKLDSDARRVILLSLICSRALWSVTHESKQSLFDARTFTSARKPGTVDRKNNRCDISLCLLQDAAWSQAFASVVIRNCAVASLHPGDMVAFGRCLPVGLIISVRLQYSNLAFA